MLAPSSTCWEFPVEETLEIARETVDSGLWFLAGYDNGEFVLNRKPREFSPLKNYLLKQARFRHLKEKEKRSLPEAGTRSGEKYPGTGND